MLPFILQGAGAVAAGVSTGVSTYGQMSKLKAAQPPGVPKIGADVGKNFSGGVAAPSLPGNPYSYKI
jgi:hypothetical protein